MKSGVAVVAVAMISLLAASQAFADNFNTNTGELQGKGFQNSGNDNAVLNAGAGNGGEGFAGFHHTPTAFDTEAGFREQDPGQSGDHNRAPSTPPGQ